ncbi:MAG: V-type ATPase subunit [Candidatus Atribacteria bacterium]|nr:V-type ATPase subunit [Candidatus Atribacteria bacterium]
MQKYINERSNTQEEYGYACARIKVLEKSLLNQEVLDKMIDSSNLENAVKMLSERNISEYIFEKTEPSYIDQSIKKILNQTIHVIHEISPYSYLPYILNLKYDFHNIKVLLKSKFLNKKEPYPVYEFGNISLDFLKFAIFEDKFQTTPIKIEKMIKKCQEYYIRSDDLEGIEILLDQGYYRLLFETLDSIEQPFLSYFYKSEIDLLNIMIACRAKVRQLNKSRLNDILIKYGNFHPTKIAHIYENSIDSWINYFKKSDYSVIVEKGILFWQQENSLLELERLSNNYLLDLLKIGKAITFGIESIVGYYYAKQNDIHNILTILNGKRYSLPIQMIRKRLRNSYV